MMVDGPGRNGWYQVTADDGVVFWAQVAYSPRKKRARIVGVYISDMTRVSQAGLRSLPLRHFEAIVNQNPEAWGVDDRAVTRGHAAVLKAVNLEDPSPAPQTHPWGENEELPFAEEDLMKFRDDNRSKPDEFYQYVADMYGAIVRRGERGPATVIAGSMSVPVTTVHRWVREARARGLMAPGEAGRAG